MRVNYNFNNIFDHFLDLMAIAEWLSLNDHDEFMNVYAAVRGSLMKRSLDLVGRLFVLLDIVSLTRKVVIENGRLFYGPDIL